MTADELETASREALIARVKQQHETIVEMLANAEMAALDFAKVRAMAEQCSLRQAMAEAEVKRLRDAIVREVSGCFCDDVDGNCNVLRPACERCQRLGKALK